MANPVAHESEFAAPADPTGSAIARAPELVTFGCRLNAYESEVMRGAAAGLDDTVLVNTCAVTGEAVRQARQQIRKLRRQRPTARIVVTGCAAQTEPAMFAAMPEVDFVIGNTEKLDPGIYRRMAQATSDDTVARAGALARVSVGDIMASPHRDERLALNETAHHLIAGFGGRARAYVQIQNGCDHRCTFCIIPYGRGPSRSVPSADVVSQVRVLVERGYAEIVLTGVDMTAWGRDFGDSLQLGDLVRRILREVPDLKRLRLSSIDSIETDAALIESIASEPRLMPHLHLSLQAGDDMTLKRMKRRHLRADSIAFCRDLRRLRPDIVFGADLIAGFPTETDAMFDNTMRLVDECGLTYLHVFPYSPRAGTPAARMPEVPRTLVKERAERLRAKGREALGRHLQGCIGAEVELLMEQDGLGRTPQFTEMRIDETLQGGDAFATGSIVRARVAGHDGVRLTGAAT